jgi:adenine-specific DNA-methyltransferase
LKKVVDPALVSETERYDFRWYGKTKSKREAFTPSRAALAYDPARSVNPEKAGGNMIIEGENLEVLKLLTSAYRERIKCIYIDPPYNTGKDFVYSDNFAEGQKPYWEQTGVTEGGVKVDTNTDSDGRFHSNWLSMMHSRLLVARYLLRPDGVIFVSIDDRELNNLRRLMDEVFGDENFLAVLIWHSKKGGGGDVKTIVAEHEYVLAYSKSDPESAVGRRMTEAEPLDLSDQKGPFRKGRELNKWGAGSARADRPTMFFPIPGPQGEEIFPIRNDGSEGRWRLGKPAMMKIVNEGNALFERRVDGATFIVYEKIRSADPRWKSYRTILSDAGSAAEGTSTLKELFDGVSPFDFPKPPKLLCHLLEIAAVEEDDTILDFFAGSGTTAQAVLDLNKADGGNRKFILVQLPELTAEDSPAFKAGFKRISDITVERAKRVVQKLKTEAEGLLPNDPQRQFADSLGFKVYTLARSAFPRVEFAPDPAKTEAENIELLKQYIREKEATFHLQFEKDKVLDEVLLKNGFMLDYTLTRQPEFKKNEVFLAKDAYKESLVCLDAKLEPETVDHFKTHKDQFFICLELALDTTKKWNLKHNLGEKLKAI